MRILIAEDDSISRRVLEAMLQKWGYEVVVTCDGEEAWQALDRDDAPPMAILDWMMPGLDGGEVVRRARQRQASVPTYIIMLTAKSQKTDIVAGLDTGADDYITKPFDRDELRARVQVGARIVELQSSLADRVRELEAALAQVKQLQTLLPICSYCKKIRDDKNYWQQVDAYIMDHSEVRFSHGVCPDCFAHHVAPELEKYKRLQEGKR
jgi:DNA-binding response OmpR family regulator